MLLHFGQSTLSKWVRKIEAEFSCSIFSATDRESRSIEFDLSALLRGDPQRPRSAALAGRLVRVLAELHLVSLDPDQRILTVPEAERTALERSAAFRAYQQRYEDGRRWLIEETAKAA